MQFCARSRVLEWLALAADPILYHLWEISVEEAEYHTVIFVLSRHDYDTVTGLQRWLLARR